MSEENGQENKEEIEQNGAMSETIPVTGMYENWFLDYASYVILERAVPAVNDGFKPVQRRIMHSLKEMDDGRFNKVANVIGHTMQFHPHGDASIGDAIINLGQKELLIDTQGNWGDIRTGDSAAAPRYIEARLSKFALEVLYNPQTTDWQLSYDGRKKEPVTLPVKFPMLLAQGVEGIAVGLSTRILPHNFLELIDASINLLNGKRVKIYPDFPTGGLADIAEYDQGKRGGRVKVRARMEVLDKKTLIIKEIPYGTTTTSLIDSILKANDKGKIKIKQVVDNTAKDVEILVSLAPGQSPDMTMDALYAFTDCEVSIAPNACVIIDEKPAFLTVVDILKANTDQTVELLTRELEIRKGELMEKILFSSLEKIFIENRIYRDIEECETWEAVIETIDKGLEPFKPQFYREITEEDIVRLTEIKIKRISKFDSFKADELMKRMEEELKETEHHLGHITEYAIAYFEKLREKYGKGKERRTELTSFESIDTTAVVANNAKLYVNREDGFVGMGLRRDEFVADCSDIDDIIVIRKDGKMMVSRIADKVYMGKGILYAGVWKKGDERMVYNMIYLDGKSGRSMVKRFNVTAITRDKEYNLTKGDPKSKTLYLSANPNGEAEIVTVKLTSSSKARKKVFDFDFSELDIKGRGAGGNILTKYAVRRVEFKEAGTSTLSGLDIWYDDAVGRLNKDERGLYIGKFHAEDQIIVFYKEGDYELTTFELTNKYEAHKVVLIERFDPEKIYTAVHYDGGTGNYYVKRFQIETSTPNKKFSFISEEGGSKMILVSGLAEPMAILSVKKGKSKDKTEDELNLADIVDVKGWKANGNKLTSHKFISLKLAEVDETAVEQKSGSKSRRKTSTKPPVKPDAESKPAKEKKVPDVEDAAEEKEVKAEKKVQKADKKPQAPKEAKKGKDDKEDGGYQVGDTIELNF